MPILPHAQDSTLGNADATQAPRAKPPGWRLRHALAAHALAVACAGLAAFANPAHADDLLSVYRLAQSRDAVFEAARQQAIAAMERLPQARAGLRPAVTLASSAGRQLGRASFAGAEPVDRGVRNTASTLQLTQPLLRPASWLAVEQADAQVRQALAQYAQAQQDLILRVAQRYFDVLLAQDGIAVAERQRLAVRSQLELARRNFEVGTATVTDVHEATSRHDLARAQHIAAVNELEARQIELARIVGEAPPTLDSLLPDATRDMTAMNVQIADAQDWVMRAQTASPLVRIQEAARDAADREVARADAAHLPTLDLTASYGRTFSAGSLTSPADLAVRNRVAQVGLQFSLPLYSGGALDSRAREAVAAHGKALADLDDARRQAGGQARLALAGITGGQAQTEALASAVASSRSAVAANQMGYRIGTRINIDVLNAEQQFYAAQRDLAKSRVDTLMNSLRLKAAAGVLDEDALRSLDTLLEPAAQAGSAGTPAAPVGPLTTPSAQAEPAAAPTTRSVVATAAAPVPASPTANTNTNTNNNTASPAP